jgi:3-oxoacyl-(acyl-carrier-protein) synthase
MDDLSTHNVFVEASGLYCAAGDSAAGVADALVQGRQNRAALPFPGDWLPCNSAYIVADPDAATLGIDRKALRTMEKQSRLALHGAMLAANGSLGSADPSRVGLFVGLPTIEEEVPAWSALEEIHRSKNKRLPQELLMAATPKFSGLVLLNSTACAHISGQLGISGAMGAFSQFADAGAQSLIEGALSIVEGENDVVLAGGVSPKINPFLFLQYEHLGALDGDGLVPGEATAFVRLSNAPAASAQTPVRIAGFGRSFAVEAKRRLDARIRAMTRALDSAGIAPADVDWIMFDRVSGGGGSRGELEALESLFERDASALPLCTSNPATGFTGPADPVLGVALALEGLRQGYRLRVDAERRVAEREAADVKHVLINASGFHGQFVSLVLARDAR